MFDGRNECFCGKDSLLFHFLIDVYFQDNIFYLMKQITSCKWTKIEKDFN